MHVKSRVQDPGKIRPIRRGYRSGELPEKRMASSGPQLQKIQIEEKVVDKDTPSCG